MQFNHKTHALKQLDNNDFNVPMKEAKTKEG